MKDASSMESSLAMVNKTLLMDDRYSLDIGMKDSSYMDWINIEVRLSLEQEKMENWLYGKRYRMKKKRLIFRVLKTRWKIFLKKCFLTKLISLNIKK